MLGEQLMGILYKGYSVPEIKGRYVDMGMAFKAETKGLKHESNRPRTRYKPGELRTRVLEMLTYKWTHPKELAPLVNAAVESTRSALDDLTKLGVIECNGIKGMKQYRKPKEQTRTK